MQQNLSGNITLFSGVISVLISLLFCEFHKLHPNVTLSFMQAHEQHFVQRNDIIITTRFTDSDAWSCQELLKEELFVAVPIDHPFASRESIRMSELANESFIFSNNRENDYLITQHFITSGFRPKVLIQCDNLHTVMSIVSYGIGITVVAASNRSYCSNRIKLLSVVEPSFTRKILMYRPSIGNGNYAADRFAQYITDHISQLYQSVQLL